MEYIYKSFDHLAPSIITFHPSGPRYLDSFLAAHGMSNVWQQTLFSLCGGINSDMSTIYDDFHAYSGHNECDTNRRLWFFVKRFFVKRFFVKRFFVYRYTNTEYSHIYITASVTVFFGSTDTKVCIVTLTGMVLLYFSWVQFSRDYSSTT